MPKILEKPTIECFSAYLKNCTKIILLTGAGISTSAGIPDFRSPSTGLYANLQKYDLPYPEAIFELDYFLETPEPFFTLTRELFPGKFKPTKSHLFIKLLQKEGVLLRNYTQNIDMLERLCGIDHDLLVEAHGSFSSARCVGKSIITPSVLDTDDDRIVVKGCGKEMLIEDFKVSVFKGGNPTCDCGGYIKPDIVFFGEGFHEKIEVDFDECDALIIMGTSLKVMPFAGLINRVKPTVPRLLINLEAVGEDSDYSSGFNFSGEDELCRDAFHKATTDEGVELLAKLMGLSDKFEQMIRDHSKDLLRSDDKTSSNNGQVDAKPGTDAKVTGGETIKIDKEVQDLANALSETKI